MRLLDVQDLDDIALGASLLGAGGGGDPYIGKLVAINAIRKYGPVKLLDPSEIEDDAFLMPIAMMGAPSVLLEKAIGTEEYSIITQQVEKRFGRKVYATMPMEAGGLNSMLPIAAAAMLGLPVVDVDGMGRAFPELQMVTFTMGGVSCTPMVLCDEKGNNVSFDTITNKWAEDLARSVCMTCGGEVSVALYCMDGKTMKQWGVKGILTREQEIGKAIRTLKEVTDKTPEEAFFERTEGFKLFKGKICDVRREVRGAFNFGKCCLEGIGDYKGQEAFIEFQNENLLANVNGKILATTPDIITLIDCETFQPITTDSLKYGKRVFLVCLKCYPLWRTEIGLELAGPRYFGVETDYIPVEERCKG